MRTTFVFMDGTSWEWEDDPKDYEGIEIKKKYFFTEYPLPNGWIHPEIMQIIESE